MSRSGHTHCYLKMAGISANDELWNSKPLSINEHVYVLPSQKNHHLQRFLNKIPTGKLIDVSEVDKIGGRNFCVMGKVVENTPLGEDRQNVVVTLKDFQCEARLELKMCSKNFKGIKTMSDGSLMYFYGGKYIPETNTLEALDDDTEFTCYIINRWIYRHLYTPVDDVTQYKKSPLKTYVNKASTSTKTLSSPLKKDGGYEYTKIKDLIIGSKCNTAGIVKSFKPCFRSRGTDYCSSYTLIDQTNPTTGISVMSFNKDPDALPKIQRVGDIVLLRRVTINSFNDLPQALVKAYSSFHVFDSSLTSPLVSYCKSTNATFSETDKKLVEELKKWSNSTLPSCSVCSLKDIQPNVEFGLICQVVSVATLFSNKAVCLSVCDGTKPSLTCTIQSISTDDIVTDPILFDQYGDHICDILLYDESIPRTSHIKPSQYVYLSSLIATPEHMKTSDGSNITVFTLHSVCDENATSGVFSYSVLPETDPSVIKLKTSLSSIVSRPYQLSGYLHSAITFTPRTDVCFTPIADILTSSSPYKYRCFVSAAGIEAEEIGDLVQLRCAKCSTDYPLPTSAEEEESGMYHKVGTPCFTCEKRIPSDIVEVVEVPLLEYVYAFMLYVKDDTGSLPVLIAEEEGRSFIGGPPPGNFYIDSESGELVLKRLKALFGRDPFLPSAMEVEAPPMDCCIYSYRAGSIDGSLIYRLFDTYLVYDDGTIND